MRVPHSNVRPLLILTALFVFATTSQAQSRLRFELGNHGMAVVTASIHPSSGSTSATTLSVLALPFQLDAQARISKPDNIQLSILSNRDNYCLLGMLASSNSSDFSIRIDDAIKLTDERTFGRVKLACDNAYQFLKEYRGILALPSTIYKYDVTISLPQQYRNEELSFQPPQDRWISGESGRAYTLPISAPGAEGEIWIAFPSPFKSGLQGAQILLSIIFGVALLGLEGKVIVDRSLGRRMLFATLVLALLAIILTAYFAFTLADPREFIAWAAGPLVPLIMAPFMCVWMLIRPLFEAELGGRVTLDGGPPTFVEAWLYRTGASGVLSKRPMKLSDEGAYRHFVWCPKSSVTVYIVAAGGGTSESKSGEYALAAKKRVAVPTINVLRAQVRNAQ